MKHRLFLGAVVAMASPAIAQHTHETHGESPAEASAQEPRHVGHDTAAAPESEEEGEVGNAPAPSPPADHAADAIFGKDRVAFARKVLARENGHFRGSMVLFELAEYQARRGGDGYRWEGEAWIGGDLDKLLIKHEGEGAISGPIEAAEVQLLYARAVAPYWNAHVGVRHDIVPNPSRTHVVLGIEGIAPYWFHLKGQLFVSEKGEVSARAEGSYDQRLTQRLILSPRVELNLAAQDVQALDIGSGLSNVELGLRMRYEFSRKFAPYAGIEWARIMGNSARFARAASRDPDVTNFVAGIRFWF